jgi:hypothetical protein
MLGIGLGYIEYTILRPEPLSKSSSLSDIWLPAIILLIFTGLMEEVIFRGVMGYVSLRGLSRYGIFYVSAIFAVLHLGYKSIPDVIFVFAVALLFSIITIRTGSILGVTLAHGLTNIGLFLIFPFMLGSATVMNSSSPQELVVKTATTTPTAAYSTPTLSKQFTNEIKSTPESSSAQTQAPRLPTQPFISPTVILISTTTPLPTQTNTLPVSDTATPTRTPTPFETAFVTPTLSRTALPAAPSPTIIPFATQTVTSTMHSPFGILIDDGDIDFLRSGGEEYLSPEGFGGDFVWTTTTDGIARVQVEWRPTLTICGTYQVDVFIPSGINLTKSAFYQVGYRQGMSSRLINQSANQGNWVSLGEYESLPTSGTFLRLTNSTGEVARSDLAIIFDAARWTLISTCLDDQP